MTDGGGREELMEIRVKTMDANEHRLKVKQGASVIELKSQIEEVCILVMLLLRFRGCKSQVSGRDLYSRGSS
jgi:hypothetical protein